MQNYQTSDYRKTNQIYNDYITEDAKCDIMISHKLKILVIATTVSFHNIFGIVLRKERHTKTGLQKIRSLCAVFIYTYIMFANKIFYIIIQLDYSAGSTV